MSQPGQPSSVPRIRRNKSKHDYAALNKRGLQSAKSVKIKSKVKSKVVKNRELCATPGSGDWRVELRTKYDQNLVESKLLDGDSKPSLVGSPISDKVHVTEGGKSNKEGGSHVGGTKSNNRSVTVTSLALSSKMHSGDSPLLGQLLKQSPLAHDANDIIHLVLQKNMSLEDRKRKIRENIARMKKQLQQKEEDEELLALMKEEEELCLQLG